MKKKAAFLLAFIIIAIPFLIFAQQTQRGLKVVIKTKEGSPINLYNQYRALVIGVSDYLYWPKLPNALNDAHEVANQLRKRNFLTRILENPTSEKIKNALNRLIYQESEDDDGVLIYFAGHGETERLADDTELGYIVPADCPVRSRDPSGFAKNAISMEDFQTYSLRLKSKHLIILFDSCFSGSIFTLGRAAPADISFKTAQPVRQYITAGRADEIVPDKSIFKVCFLEALNGEADANRDGYVTGSELGMYLESNVVNYSRNAQHPQYGKIRNPKLDKGDFVFILNELTNSEPMKNGFLEISCYPYGELFIDGKLIGEIPPFRKIELSEGEYKIKLIKDRKIVYEETIYIKAGESKTVHHIFE